MTSHRITKLGATPEQLKTYLWSLDNKRAKEQKLQQAKIEIELEFDAN